MRHTELPWKVEFKDTNGHGGWEITHGDNRICTVYANIVFSPRKGHDLYRDKRNNESISNAHLIAAAPELLEALRPFAQYECGCGECHNCIAKAVILKAEAV